MYNSFLIFDFGTNEDAAQQARHKLDGWKQAFRLDKKLLYKFERQPGSEPAPAKGASEKPDPEKPSKSVKEKARQAKPEAKPKPVESTPAPADGAAPPSADVKLLVRLYFSGHEKLSYQRWADRIPDEEPFKQASPQTIRLGDAQFAEVNHKFDALE